MGRIPPPQFLQTTGPWANGHTWGEWTDGGTVGDLFPSRPRLLPQQWLQLSRLLSLNLLLLKHKQENDTVVICLGGNY